jgi:hypothetical protein
MVARFEGDIEHRAVRKSTRLFEGGNLRVVASRRLGEALPYDLAVLDDDCPDGWIGTR